MSVSMSGSWNISGSVSLDPVAPFVATAGATTSVSALQNQTLTNFNPFSSVVGGYTPYTYYVSSGILPPGLALNPTTGQVSGTPTTVQNSAPAVFAVQDSSGQISGTTVTVNFAVSILPVVAIAGTTTSVAGLQNTAITSFSPFSSISNGFAPYVYSVFSGTLPPGITLNSSTGLISGSPTTLQGASNVVFIVKDSQNNQAATTATISFTINAVLSATAGATTTSSTIVGTTSTSFNPFSSVTGGYAPYTYFVSSGTLPTGITINSSTGLVSGTPSLVQSSASVVFAVKDSQNNQAATTATVSFTVTTIASVAGSTTTVTATQNTAISSFYPFSSVTGGYTPYTYYVSTGTLPTGITIDGSTGLVSGTPTIAQSSASVVFAVKDSQNNQSVTTSTVSFTVAISYTINYLAVGGGGGGGGFGTPGTNGATGGGGGGGGLLNSSFIIGKGTILSISIGPGGAGATFTPAAPVSIRTLSTAGTPSSISAPAVPTFTSIIASGGGRGGCSYLGSPTGAAPGLAAGGSGGSGGGGGGAGAAGQSSSGPGGPGGTGTPGQGNAGGIAGNSNTATYTLSGGGGGGGGAGGTGTAGTAAPPTNPGPGGPGGPGGAGAFWPFTGPAIFYAGGGGGGGGQGNGTASGGSGGPGGGGIGATATAGTITFNPAQNATPGTGGGGGGSTAGWAAGWPPGGAGGSGIIILAISTPNYPGSAPGATVTTPPSAPGYTVLTWTSPGTFTA